MPTMQTAQAMVAAHPGEPGLDRDLLARAVDLMVACSTACTVCADACLAEDMVAELVRCVRTDADCADVCLVASRVMGRQTAYDADVSRAVVQACLVACRACERECAGHADMHEHCRVCAEACRECAEVCEELLAAMG